MNQELDCQKERILEDHEMRIRKLEESDIKQQIQLAEIQKSQSDLKSLILETSKEQNMRIEKYNDNFTKFTDTTLKMFNDSMQSNNKILLNTLTETVKTNNDNNKNNNETKNKIKLTDRKEFWGIIVTLVGLFSAYVTYLIK